MALGLFHCYQAKIGIGPPAEQEIIAEEEAEDLALLPSIFCEHITDLEKRITQIRSMNSGQ